MSVSLAELGPPPARCGHCGHDDPNEFLPMGGAYFCGACGKKLTPAQFDGRRTDAASGASGPAAPTTPNSVNASADLNTSISSTASNDSSSDASRGRGFFAAITGRFAKGSSEDNKENTAPIPSASATIAPATPMKSQSSAVIHPTITTTDTAAPQPSSASATAFVVSTPSHRQPAPSPTRGSSTPSHRRPAGGSGSGNTSLSSIDHAALFASIRTELQASFDAEQTILNMERDELQEQLDVAHDDRLQLQSQLDQLMHDYQALIEESTARKNDYVANSGILEAELSALRDQRDRELFERRDMFAAVEASQKLADERGVELAAVTDALSRVTAELDELKQKHNTLRDTATNKLKASAQEYMAIRQREQEKDIYLAEIVRELQQAQEKQSFTAARLKDSEEQGAKLAKTCQVLEHELKQVNHDLVTKNTALANAQSQAAEYKGKADELAAVCNRYKEQLLEQRERMRNLDKERVGLTELNGGLARIEDELRLAKDENQTLKSQLFDAMAVEKALRSAADSKGTNSAALVDNARLQNELERKESENRELLMMVDTLMQQLEQQSHQQHSETF